MGMESFNICLDIIMQHLLECDERLEEALILEKEDTIVEFYRGQKSALTKVLRDLNKVK